MSGARPVLSLLGMAIRYLRSLALQMCSLAAWLVPGPFGPGQAQSGQSGLSCSPPTHKRRRGAAEEASRRCPECRQPSSTLLLWVQQEAWLEQRWAWEEAPPSGLSIGQEATCGLRRLPSAPCPIPLKAAQALCWSLRKPCQLP